MITDDVLTKEFSLILMATKTAPWVLKLGYKGGQVPQHNALVKPFSSENLL